METVSTNMYCYTLLYIYMLLYIVLTICRLIG